MSIFWNGVETNTVMLNGVETTGVWNGEVVWGLPQFKTLTLYHSEGGTLTADTLTGYPGDTINLSTAYNTYWRFSGYQWTGDGTLSNNTYTFGDEDASICACYKKNAFTATGGFEKGSNITYTARGYDNEGTTAIAAKYAIHGAHTGNVPAAWYNTSNRWKVTSTVSAYKITLNPKMRVKLYREYHNSSANATIVSLVGSTTSNSQFVQCTSYPQTTYNNYSKSFTSTNTGVNYGVSGNVHLLGGKSSNSRKNASAVYEAAGTSGTWTATGYAP